MGDIRELAVDAEGIWSSFAAAYLSDLPAVLRSWGQHLRPGGWIALTEIDDLFGHEPLGERVKALLDAYAAQAVYDFKRGRKLAACLEEAGFTVASTFTCEDAELSFDGPARPDVIEAWRDRFDRMHALRSFCGDEFEDVRDAFVACLSRQDHRSLARVYCCIARWK